MQTTITEALAEIKLIEKKLEQKKQVVLNNLTIGDHAKDPFESEGGSAAYLKKEVQSIRDLEVRQEKIRSAIADANLATQVTVGEKTKTLYEWLVWKREIATNQINFAKNVHESLKRNQDEFTKNVRVFEDPATKEKKVVKFTNNLEYAEFIAEHQRLTQLVEELDGKLSLKNATVKVVISH